jgi:peptidoglycan/xylan/chitin deacetylase (PgdA/CDA1 family)/glycosyltransferase involved in cell wall biosynthesis
MNILHTLSQNEVTGAETYAAALANEQVRNGHTVWIVSDTFRTPTRGNVLSMPIGKRNFRQRLRNIFLLRTIVRDKAINVVHAHSRAASWVSYFATRGGTVPLVSTIHGRQHVHLSSRIFRVYGEQILAVCESIRDHLIEKLGIPKDTVAIVRNGIDLSEWRVAPAGNGKKKRRVISLVGRLSGPKGDVVRKIVEEVFPKIIASCPDVELDIVGGMKETEGLEKLIAAAQKKTDSAKISYVGFVENVAEVYRRSSVVIGSGRVAMEALACGSNVIAVGESNYIGPVTEQTRQVALETNFGDAGANADFSVARAAAEIVSCLENKTTISSDWGRRFICAEFDIKKISVRVAAAYTEAIALKMNNAEIPVLMYHRVTDGKPAGTKHGIYVTQIEFERQLAYLKRTRCTTLTFADAKAIEEGTRIIPKRPVILTFDDGYEDNYIHAFPLLRKYSFSAVIFLIGNPAIRTNAWDAANGEPEARLMSDAQIKAMAAYGIEFGAHSLNHKKLTEIPLSDAKHEIEQSKLAIEKRLGAPIISFAYPYGKLNEELKGIVKGAGFHFGIASDSGPRRFWKDFLEVRRIQIFPGFSLFSFWKKSSGWYHKYKRIA